MKRRRTKRCAPPGLRSARRLQIEKLETRIALSATPAYDEVDASWFASVVAPSVAGPAPAPVQWIIRLTPAVVASTGSVAEAAKLLADLPATVVRGLGLPGQLLLETAPSQQATIAA